MRKTSIIILSYHTLDLTRLCIESIRSFTAAGTYEILVVDNGSQDGSREWLAAQSDVRLQANAENAGFPRGCNQGMALAEAGNDLLLLNSDTIVTPRWLENLQAALHSRPEIGAVSCLTNACSNFQSIPAKYEDIDGMISFADAFNQGDPAKWFPWLTLVGFCLLIRREAYETIGPMDARYSPGNYEDDDYSIRLRQAGYEMLLCEDTFIHHFGSASFRQGAPEEQRARSQRYEQLSQRNRAYLLEKFHLPADYKVKHGMVDALPQDLPAGTRVCLVNASCGYDLFFLHSRYPQLRLSGVTFSEVGQQLAGRSFPMRCAATWEEVPACVPDEQDIFFILGNAREIPQAGQLIQALRARLAAGGAVYYGDAERVYCQPQGD